MPAWDKNYIELDVFHRYLELSLDKEKVLPVDSIKIFRSLSKNKIGYELMRTFFVNNLEAIHKL